MTTTAPAQTQLGGQQYGQSAWHHVSATIGGMGQQTAGANGAIATKMTGGRRRRSRRDRQSHKVDRKQSKSRRQGQRRQRQSKKQRGGRR